MKILYAIQATGNGHIARAAELLPYFRQYGTVDVFLSGSNANLRPDFEVKYRSKGLSLFYGNRGGLDYKKMWRELDLRNTWREAKALPVEKYDLVINDFECITALSCRIKKVPSIHFGHQASFRSPKTPRPTGKDLTGEFILKNYACATAAVGLHFEKYDNFIFPPVIKQEILQASPTDQGHITVYLSHYNDDVVARELKKIPDYRFEIFSKKVTQKTVDKNISFLPVGAEAFNRSMLHCHGMITGAGFETPAEILYLRKKLLCLPIRGQYEQLCNAAALQQFQVPVLKTIDQNFPYMITKWLSSPNPFNLAITHSTYEIVQQVFETGHQLKTVKNHQYEFPLTEEDFAALY